MKDSKHCTPTLLYVLVVVVCIHNKLMVDINFPMRFRYEIYQPSLEQSDWSKCYNHGARTHASNDTECKLIHSWRICGKKEYVLCTDTVVIMNVIEVTMLTAM